MAIYKKGYVYILMNKKRTVIYTGVTNDLVRRVYEHKNKMVEGFTQRYNICDLVYFEEFQRMDEAIAREKQIKGWSRAKKEDLINKNNPNREDLYFRII